MANIMQYLIQMSDEFRESYVQIENKVYDIMDKLDLIEVRLKELEQRVNINRDNSKD